MLQALLALQQSRRPVEHAWPDGTEYEGVDDPTAIRPRVSRGRVLNGLACPGRRSPRIGIASTTTPINGVTTHSHEFWESAIASPFRDAR